jgi:hypothetical protein
VCVVALTNIGRFGRTNRSIEQTESRKVMRHTKEMLPELWTPSRPSDCGWLAAAMLPQQ